MRSTAKKLNEAEWPDDPWTTMKGRGQLAGMSNLKK
jgi:hypothetical protein